ncbi:MAG: DUF4870 domain-containing protein [Chloroflexi bacterium]|nr:DUF4870 domain-containing protein [Chloroflexota bacterium]
MIKQTRQLLGLALLVTFLATLWVQWPRLIDPYQIEEDFRNYYWMHRFQDAELFENDPLIFNRIQEFEIGEFRLIVDTASPGYTLLFQAASNFMSFVLFSKALAFPLTLISVAYLFGIGYKLKDAPTAFALSLAFLPLNFAAATAISTIGGLQRSFIFPLLLGFIYHLMKRQDKTAVFFIFLGGVIYPSVFVLGAATYALTLIQLNGKKRRFTIDWRRAIPLLTVSILLLIVLLPVLISQIQPSPEEGGRQQGELFLGAKRLLSDPLYQSGGRIQLLEDFPLVGRMGLATPGIDFIFIAFLGILALAIWLLNRDTARDLDPTLKQFFLAIWICFALSWFAFLLLGTFPLYLASRYTEAGLILFLLIFTAINGQDALRRFTRLMVERSHLAGWFLLPTAVLTAVFAFILPSLPTARVMDADSFRRQLLFLATALVGFSIYFIRRPQQSLPGDTPATSLKWPWSWGLSISFLLVSAWFIAAFKPGYYGASSAERALFAYLETLPKDVSLNGAPRILSSIPTFAKRKVPFSCESPNFDPEIIMPSLRAYYASVGQESIIADFCNDRGIDYLVADTRNFAAETIAGEYCSFAPYDDAFRKEIGARSDFALNHAPEAARVFQEESLFVVACDPNLFMPDEMNNAPK